MIILMMAKLYQVSYIRRRSGKTGNICGRGREYISRHKKCNKCRMLVLHLYLYKLLIVVLANQYSRDFG